MKAHIISLSAILIAKSAFAQFQVNGDAGSLGGNCYRLTTDDYSKAGAMWNSTQINLDNSFDFSQCRRDE